MTAQTEFTPRVEIYSDAEAVAERAAGMIAEVITTLPAPVLGVATGRTPVPIYKRLQKLVTEGMRIDHLRAFALDEYVGLEAQDPASYHVFLEKKFFGPVGLAVGNWHVPDGMAEPHAEAERYETAIRNSGGVDLQLLGLGRNGHIGFNEPGSPIDSLTRLVRLSADTCNANADDFRPEREVPPQALTMGIGTILRARKLLIVATGETKTDALAAALEGPISTKVPASALRLHPDATVLADSQAAAGLTRWDHRAI